MQSLFIDRKGTTLDVIAGRLVIRVPDKPRPVSLPLKQVRYLVLSASVDLSSTVLLSLNSAGITLVIINPRHPDGAMICGGQRHGNVARRMRQYAMLQDDGIRLGLARQLLRAKLQSQYRALARQRGRRPDLRHPLTAALRNIRERWQSIPACSNIASLRGLEGAAAAAYFSAMTKLVAPAWGFTGRKRRPPPDPVNAVLSLTYTLVHGEALRALMGYGLDPGLGCLHDIDYNRESLACDLVELLRADCDSWVLALFRSQTLRECHFQQPAPNQSMLNKEGRAIFYPEYQCEAKQWQKRCRHLARQWAALLGDIEEINEEAKEEESDDESPLPDD